MSEYGYRVDVAAGYDEAVISARLALKSEGFSILSEMDVGGLLGPEAGSERQHLILGVWNAVLAQRRLDEELKAAVHLPCNVVVRETTEGAMIAAMDPADVDDAAAAGNETAQAARDALERALTRIGSGEWAQ